MPRQQARHRRRRRAVRRRTRRSAGRDARADAADFRQHPPAALAFLALGEADTTADARHVGEREGAVGRRPVREHDAAVMHSSARSTPASSARRRRCRDDVGAACRLEPMRFAPRSSSSAPVTTRRSSRIRVPARAERRRRASRRASSGTCSRWMLRAVAREAGEPGLLGGEAQHRRQPGGQAAEQLGPAPCAPRGGVSCRRVAIERVLADVEVEGRQIDGAEIVQRGEQARGNRTRRSRCARCSSSSARRCSTQRSSSGICAGATARRRRSRRGCPAGSAACCAAGDRRRPCRFRISGPMRRSSAIVRRDHPQAQDVGAAVSSSPPAAR